jgi:hypothetical protein
MPTYTALHGVSNNRPTAQIGYIYPELVSQIILHQIVVQVDESHARLQDAVRTIYIDFKNLVQILAHV